MAYAAGHAMLSEIVTSGVPGLPDTRVPLRPVTALIGPRASGKSRVLASIAWLLTGRPALHARQRASTYAVSGVLDGTHPRNISRRPGEPPAPPLPRCTFLTARARIADSHRVDRAALTADSGAERLLARLERWLAAQVTGELLLIEEPELDLNPQAQRYLYRLLRAYGERNQVIYSTRSPSLVDAAHHDEIIRLDITARGLSIRRTPPGLLSDEERLRLTAEFDRERSEMFFATAVVLVEGQTERQSLPVIFRALGHDPDALGISIVEVGGKGNLPLAARILGELNVPHLLVYDSDRNRPGAELNARLAAAAPGAAHFLLDPDFEAAAGLRANNDKVLNAWRRFAGAPPKKVPRIFRQIVATAVAMAAPDGPSNG